MSRIFIHEFPEVIPDIPDGSRVHLHNVPQIGFHSYTLQSWLNLTYPSKHLTVSIVKSRQKADVYFDHLSFKIEKTNGRDDTPAGVLQELAALTAAELDELKDLYLRVKRNKQIDVRSVDEMVKRFIKGFREEADSLRLLASLKSSHEYTFTHVVNVGILTMAQAESLGFPGEHLHQIGVASFLHDIGQLFVPEEILNKKGNLSQEERSVIETHTAKGARYLMGTEGIPKLAVLASLEHHLKFDGSGYPSIKGGWTPNIASQMIAIADVFDAMRSRRSYQEPRPMSQIESVLKGGAGKAFNPKLIDNFFRLIRM